MKRFPLVVLALFASSLSALAQSESSYRIDNFDFANGVRIEVPPPPAVNLGKNSRTRKLLTSNNLIYSHSTAPLTKLTAMSVSNSLEGFTTGNANVDTFIVESGKRNSVDPLLLYAVMHQESTFKQGAVSPKGARGLMQLMPPTARRFGVMSIFDPKQNIEGGARYMRFLLDLFEGNVELALAGYNAGEGAVMKYGYRVPPYRETQEYVRRISRRYGLIRDPLAASSADSITNRQHASIKQKTAPLTVYEQSVFAVKLSNGTLQLVSQ